MKSEAEIGLTQLQAKDPSIARTHQKLEGLSPRAFKGSVALPTAALQTPELRGDKALLLETTQVWSFVTAALGSAHRSGWKT